MPTKNNRAPSGSAGRVDPKAEPLVRMSAGIATAGVRAVELTARGCEKVVPRSDSSDSANPTGTMNAATIAASNRTRYRFRMPAFSLGQDLDSFTAALA